MNVNTQRAERLLGDGKAAGSALMRQTAPEKMGCCPEKGKGFFRTGADATQLQPAVHVRRRKKLICGWHLHHAAGDAVMTVRGCKGYADMTAAGDFGSAEEAHAG